MGCGKRKVDILTQQAINCEEVCETGSVSEADRLSRYKQKKHTM
jgi:hypothetical protein